MSVYSGDPFLDSLLESEMGSMSNPDCKRSAHLTPTITCTEGCMQGYLSGTFHVGDGKFIPGY